MLDNKGFDEWSGEYDDSIERYSQGYPFEGYYEVLGYVQSLVKANKEAKILDLGIGTGLLTNELYKNGGQIYGVDFSNKMLELAKKKMPDGNFYCFNFKSGLPEEIKELKFDYIVSSYAIHHINDKEKVEFIKELKSRLKEEGKIIIADVAFETKEKMKACKEGSKNEWDDDEFYMIARDIKPKIRQLGFNVNYTQISACAGVIEIN